MESVKTVANLLASGSKCTKSNLTFSGPSTSGGVPISEYKWEFGNGSVSNLTDGMLDTVEGCTTISDDNGDLLFYTDGLTVYDRNHQIMPNGINLFGNSSLHITQNKPTQSKKTDFPYP